MLRGRDVKRYKYEWQELYLIASHNGYDSIPAVDISVYGAVKKHLDSFEPELSKRGDRGKTQYNLRNCAYMSEFGKEKIVYQELAQGSAFALDRKGKYFINASGYLLTGDNLRYLVALLNSKLINFAYKKYYCTLIGTSGVRWQYQHIVNIPIPLPDDLKVKPLIGRINTLVDNIIDNKEINRPTESIEREIDTIVYKLYDLSNDEIKIIEQEQ